MEWGDLIWWRLFQILYQYKYYFETNQGFCLIYFKERHWQLLLSLFLFFKEEILLRRHLESNEIFLLFYFKRNYSQVYSIYQITSKDNKRIPKKCEEYSSFVAILIDERWTFINECVMIKKAMLSEYQWTFSLNNKAKEKEENVEECIETMTERMREMSMILFGRLFFYSLNERMRRERERNASSDYQLIQCDQE